MKKNYFFTVCLIMMAAVVASCGKNESKNEKNIVVSVPSQRDIERDSLELIQSVWGKLAEDKKIDFSQDTTHVLVRGYRDYTGAALVDLMWENQKENNFYGFFQHYSPKREAIPGCSLIYQGVHKSQSDQFSHYILVIDRKVYAEAQAKAKAERKVVEVRYSDGTAETF